MHAVTTIEVPAAWMLSANISPMVKVMLAYAQQPTASAREIGKAIGSTRDAVIRIRHRLMKAGLMSVVVVPVEGANPQRTYSICY